VSAEREKAFTAVFGRERGRLWHLPTAVSARTKLRARGYVRARGEGDVARMIKQTTKNSCCRECGATSLRCELYRRGRTRLRASAVFVFTCVYAACALTHTPAALFIALCVGAVAWHIQRDFGYRALGICSQCRGAQTP